MWMVVSGGFCGCALVRKLIDSIQPTQLKCNGNFFWQRQSKLHFSSFGCKPLLAWGGAEGGRRRGLEWNWTLNVCVQSQHFQFTARRRRSARHSYARPPQPPGKKRTEGRAGRHRTRQPPVRRARCRGAAPPRQTDRPEMAGNPPWRQRQQQSRQFTHSLHTCDLSLSSFSSLLQT